jgi:hypothetical protein
MSEYTETNGDVSRTQGTPITLTDVNDFPPKFVPTSSVGTPGDEQTLNVSNLSVTINGSFTDFSGSYSLNTNFSLQPTEAKSIMNAVDYNSSKPVYKHTSKKLIIAFDDSWYAITYDVDTPTPTGPTGYVAFKWEKFDGISTVYSFNRPYPNKLGTFSHNFNSSRVNLINCLHLTNGSSISFSNTNDKPFSFWAFINNSWTLLMHSTESTTADGTTYIPGILSVTNTSISTIDSESWITDLRFYDSTPSFNDINKHPKTPSFGFFQLAHSSNIGIAGNQLDDSLAIFKKDSDSSLTLANLHAHSLTLDGTNILDTINNLDLTKTSQLTIATFNSDDSISSYGQLTTGDTTIYGNITATGNLSLSFDTGITGTSYGSITAGDTTINGTLSTTGNTTLKGTLTLKNDSNQYGSITAGDTTINGTLQVDSRISLKEYDDGNKCALFLNTTTNADPEYGIWRNGSTLNISGGAITFSAVPTVSNNTVVVTNSSPTFIKLTVSGTDATTFTATPKVGNNDVAVTNTSATFTNLTLNGSTATTFTATPTVGNIAVALSNHTHTGYALSNNPRLTGTINFQDHWNITSQYGTFYDYDVSATGYRHDLYFTANSTGGPSIGFRYDSSTSSIIYIENAQLMSTSDDRLKTTEKLIENASDTLIKLKPQTYQKKPALDDDLRTYFESGLIAQEIWYDCPELRHLVHPGKGATPADAVPTSDDPSVDPDYSSWGSEPAAVNYIGFIPYLIRGFQESHAEVDALKKENAEMKAKTSSLEAQIALLMKACGLTDSGNVDSA